LDAAAEGSVGIIDVAIDAYEYLLLLHAADDEVNFGTDPQRIRAVADRLRAVSPEHVLVRLLDAKASRANVVRDLLARKRSMRKLRVPQEPTKR
jgi:hypothetical protein